MLVIRRAQQQRSRVNGTTRGDHDISGKLLARAVLADNHLTDFAAVRTRLEPLNKSICHERNVRVLERRIDAKYLCVGLRVQQTWKAVAGGAADAFAGARLLVEHHT